MHVLVLIIASLFLTVVGVAVVAFAAFTHRGLPVPGPSQLNDTFGRLSDTVSQRVGGPLENTAVSGALISSGMWITPEKDSAGRSWFVRAEYRLLSIFPSGIRAWFLARLRASHPMD